MRVLSLEESMATHSNILACRIPWTEEPGRLQSMGLQRAGHDWSDLARTHACVCYMQTLCCFIERTLYKYQWIFDICAGSWNQSHVHTKGQQSLNFSVPFGYWLNSEWLLNAPPLWDWVMWVSTSIRVTLENTLHYMSSFSSSWPSECGKSHSITI